MTADERLGLIQAKVERANKHLGDLEAEIGTFLSAHPYAVRVKRDPESRKPIHYLASVKPTPLAVATITGDTIQNLRSALDHLVHQLISIGTGQPGPFHHSEFPVFNSGSDYEAGKARKVKGARLEAIEAIDAAKPYKGGNDTLWRLHKLNLVDKHRFLIAVGSAFRSVDIGGQMVRMMVDSLPADSSQREHLAKATPLQLFIKPADRMFPLKAGDELFIGPPDGPMDEKLQFAFDVAFSEPQVIEGEPILETVHQMADMVGNVVATFKPLLN